MLGTKSLNQMRGAGAGSRMTISEDDLPAGWEFRRISPKYCVWLDPHGRKYKSSVAVRAALRDQGFLTASETEVDTASEYEPSPLKKPKTTTIRYL